MPQPDESDGSYDVTGYDISDDDMAHPGATYDPYADAEATDEPSDARGARGGNGGAANRPRPSRTGPKLAPGVVPLPALNIKPLSGDHIQNSYEDFEVRDRKRAKDREGSDDGFADWDLDDDEFKKKKAREFWDARPEWVGPKGKPIPRKGRRPSPPPPPMPPAPPPLNAAQALALAYDEDLSLPRSKKGYRGVSAVRVGGALTYKATFRNRYGDSEVLGCFETEEEAALFLARRTKSMSFHAGAESLPPPPPMSAEESSRRNAQLLDSFYEDPAALSVAELERVAHLIERKERKEQERQAEAAAADEIRRVAPIAGEGGWPAEAMLWKCDVGVDEGEASEYELVADDDDDDAEDEVDTLQDDAEGVDTTRVGDDADADNDADYQSDDDIDYSSDFEPLEEEERVPIGDAGEVHPPPPPSNHNSLRYCDPSEWEDDDLSYGPFGRRLAAASSSPPRRALGGALSSLGGGAPTGVGAPEGGGLKDHSSEGGLTDPSSEGDLTDASSAWVAELTTRIECWFIALPKPTQAQLRGCMGSLALHIGSRIDAASRAIGGGSASAWWGAGWGAGVGVGVPAADAECAWAAPKGSLRLPKLPSLPGSAPAFRLPPLPQLLPSWQRLHSLALEEEVRLAMRGQGLGGSPAVQGGGGGAARFGGLGGLGLVCGVAAVLLLGLRSKKGSGAGGRGRLHVRRRSRVQYVL